MFIFWLILSLSLIGFGIHLFFEKRPYTRKRILELLLLYQLVFSVGMTSLLAFFALTLMPDFIASFTGWPSCPFEQQLANVKKWPDDPNALMVLATTDAALGRKEDALQEGRQAVAMEPISQDAVAGPLLAGDLAQVYLLCDEQESAIKQLESLEQTPCALVYGDLAKLPEWDPLRSDPHFQRLLSRLKQPIPIVNHLPAQN